METLSEAKDTPAAGSEDDLVDHVYLYLKDRAYPNQCSASLKRQIRLRSKKFELRNGELYTTDWENATLVARCYMFLW